MEDTAKILEYKENWRFNVPLMSAVSAISFPGENQETQAERNSVRDPRKVQNFHKLNKRVKFNNCTDIKLK